jgi:hypothetical protein
LIGLCFGAACAAPVFYFFVSGLRLHLFAAGAAALCFDP